MAGATHPFFGNQYTDGGYIIGSFKFPEGLTREVVEHLPKIAVPDTVSANTNTIPSVRNSASLKAVVKTESANKWILSTIIIAAITAAGGYLTYRYIKKKGIVKIPNVGICEHCGEPLTGARLIPDADNPYIICKKCGEKNYAHSRDESDSVSTSTNEDDNQ
jgi:formylmethanofuran dehydrogenase subunit E